MDCAVASQGMERERGSDRSAGPGMRWCFRGHCFVTASHNFCEQVVLVPDECRAALEAWSKLCSSTSTVPADDVQNPADMGHDVEHAVSVHE